MQIDELPAGEQNQCPDMDMNRVVGTHDILMLCFDTLRYDVSKAEEAAGGTPVLNSHGGLWEKGMRREILLIPLILLFLQAFFLRRQSLIPCVAVNGCFSLCRQGRGVSRPKAVIRLRKLLSCRALPIRDMRQSA